MLLHATVLVAPSTVHFAPLTVNFAPIPPPPTGAYTGRVGDWAAPHRFKGVISLPQNLKEGKKKENKEKKDERKKENSGKNKYIFKPFQNLIKICKLGGGRRAAFAPPQTVRLYS